MSYTVYIGPGIVLPMSVNACTPRGCAQSARTRPPLLYKAGIFHPRYAEETITDILFDTPLPSC